MMWNPETLAWLETQEKAKAEPHRRFLVFAYPQYYPGGGQSDWIGSFDSVEDGLKYAKEHYEYSDYDVLDRVEGKWVKP